MISVRDLHFSYGARQILGGVSFDLQPGKLTFILGRNGSGKSTMLRCMAGLEPYRAGNITIAGSEMRDFAERERARIVGFLPQLHRPVFPFMVHDVVITGRAAHTGFFPSRTDAAAASEAMEIIGISHLASRLYTQLSGGEQQLVMLARIMAQKPRVLLLDEPVSHLDFHHQVKLLSLLRQLVHGGITVAAIIHDPNMAVLFGEAFLLVHDGTVHLQGDTSIGEHPLIETIFHDNIVRVPFAGKTMIFPAPSGDVS